MTYRTFLKNSKAPDPKTLVLYAAGFDLSGLVMKLDEEIPKETAETLFRAEEAVSSGTPLQYAFRKAPFYGFWFRVDERVLIPRFDSEILVNEALKAIPDGEAAEVLDLCSGSGCIGLAIGAKRPAVRLTLSDVSSDALSVAEENRKKLGVRAELIESDLFSGIDGRFDYIVSNPPYVCSAEIGSLDREVRDHEPELALNGGEDGLSFYRRIASEAPGHLKRSGRLFLEIGYDQALPVTKLLESAGFEETETVKDLAGKDRVIKACWNNWNN